MRPIKHWASTAAVAACLGWTELSLAATLRVPADSLTIQACLDAALTGVDQCLVSPGTYHEAIDFRGKAITVRSAGGAAATTIDATGLGGSVVTCTRFEGPSTVLDGFTITGGAGTDVGGWTYGGGLYNDNSSPTIANCTISGNSANYGGGMYNYFSNPTVTHCSFTGNAAVTDDGSGGGLYNFFSNPTLTHCAFIANSAGFGGGGMYNAGSLPLVIGCMFMGNTTGGNGGGMQNSHGSPTLKDCAFIANAGTYGGAMVNDHGSNPIVTHCTFSGNIADVYGGAIYNGGNPTIGNSILWNDVPDEMHNDYPATIRFSDVQGGLPEGGVDGGGNFPFDPLFARAADPGPDGTWDGVDDDYGDLRLQAGSPCIDAGDPGFVAQPGETDLEGHARVRCGRVDMGAYEYGIGDYDCDRVADLADFSSWQACMTAPSHMDAFHSTFDIRQSTIGCEAFDFDGDGDVDLLDFGGFQRIFGP